jgi:hypothetical protein
MKMIKTEKGRAELQSQNRQLNQAQRMMVILANGQTRLSTLEQMYDGKGKLFLQDLLDQGYLTLLPEQVLEPALAEQEDFESSQIMVDRFANGMNQAGAKMYLLDLCERLFAQRNKALCLELRQKIAPCKELIHLLEVAQELLMHIQMVAGIERAQTIQNKLEILLGRTIDN